MFDNETPVNYKFVESTVAQCSIELNDKEEFQCPHCSKCKPVTQGYYGQENEKCVNTSQHPFVCVQCAADIVEEQQKEFDTAFEKSMGWAKVSLKRKFSTEDYDTSKAGAFKTCLIVFDSQRQASSCVFARSKLNEDSTFCNHYHRFNKLKRQMFADATNKDSRMRNCPPCAPVLSTKTSGGA